MRVERPPFRGRAAYLTTPAGARLADVGLPAARCVAAAPAPPAGRGRPRRRAAGPAPGRDLGDASGSCAATRWRPCATAGAAGCSPARRTCRTACSSLPGGPAGGIAVELELSGKKADEYGRILRWYAGALDYRRVWWFCATPALRRKIADLVERERLGDFVGVAPLPAGVVAHGWG